MKLLVLIGMKNRYSQCILEDRDIDLSKDCLKNKVSSQEIGSTQDYICQVVYF